MELSTQTITLPSLQMASDVQQESSISKVDPYLNYYCGMLSSYSFFRTWTSMQIETALLYGSSGASF